MAGIEESYKPLAPMLGYAQDAKLIIVNGDDSGMCHTVNQAICEAFAGGIVKSTTVMTPCPWFEEFVSLYKKTPGLEAGVHLTCTSEWEHYKWGPVASRDKVPSLLAEDGYFPASEETFYKNARAEEVAIEFRAQMEKAKRSGMRITHLDSHMGVYHFNEEFYEIARDLAEEYRCTMRVGYHPRKVALRQAGWAVVDLLQFETHDVALSERQAFYDDLLENIGPGVTEIVIHCGKDNEELNAITSSAPERAFDLEYFTCERTKQKLTELGIISIGYNDLLEAQKKNLGWE